MNIEDIDRIAQSPKSGRTPGDNSYNGGWNVIIKIDENVIYKVSELIHSRSQMTEGDCDDLAWDIAELISHHLTQNVKLKEYEA